MEEDSGQESGSSESGSGSGDLFTEVTTESWFGCLGNAIKSILAAVGLCVVYQKLRGQAPAPHPAR
jgi:hypothetical protein